MSREPGEVSFRTFLALAAVVLALAVMAGYGMMGLLGLPVPTFEARAQIKPSLFDQLAAFYDPCRPDCLPAKRRPLVKKIVTWAEDATARLCIPEQTTTYLSIIHRESGYNPAVDDGDSRQVAQVRRRYERRLRAELAALGIDSGAQGSTKESVYMGALHFRNKLRERRGNVFAAVRGYNGRGDDAELYAYRVLASRARIFGEVWIPGETFPITECP